MSIFELDFFFLLVLEADNPQNEKSTKNKLNVSLRTVFILRYVGTSINQWKYGNSKHMRHFTSIRLEKFDFTITAKTKKININ